MGSYSFLLLFSIPQRELAPLFPPLNSSKPPIYPMISALPHVLGELRSSDIFSLGAQPQTSSGPLEGRRLFLFSFFFFFLPSSTLPHFFRGPGFFPSPPQVPGPGSQAPEKFKGNPDGRPKPFLGFYARSNYLQRHHSRGELRDLLIFFCPGLPECGII